MMLRSPAVRRDGVHGSKNVGISSRNAGESPAHRKSKVSWAMTIIPGLVDPKARPQGVVDGRAGEYSCTVIGFQRDDAINKKERDLVMPVGSGEWLPGKSGSVISKLSADSALAGSILLKSCQEKSLGLSQ